MFIFTKKIETNVAFMVFNHYTGKRQDGLSRNFPVFFETLKEAREFLNKTLLAEKFLK